VYLPDVAGGTSFMYNLRDAEGHRITNVRLSQSTLAKIFTRAITNWSDPAIAADNGTALPDRPITPVIRSDGSGTTAQFTAFLYKQENSIWCAFAVPNGVSPCTSTPNFPPSSGFIAQNGSDGVANYVAGESTGPGAITYVETSYALQRGFP